MMNTKALRAEYKKVRQQMSKDQKIGSIILGVLGACAVAVIVRGFCLVIVAVHSIIK